VIQLHFGGGTPNFLTPNQLSTIIHALQHQFPFSAAGKRELSIEIDPRFIQREDIDGLARLGFNRVSLGIQDFDSEVQRAVNRIQTIEQTLLDIGTSGWITLPFPTMNS
jgi:oxygen-independent coproporphyrinogen III oxidase